MEIKRQLVHLSGIILIVLAQATGREVAVAYFAMTTLFLLAYSEYILRSMRSLSLLDKVEGLFRERVMRLERKVRRPFTGAIWFYAGCTVAFSLFPLSIASPACAAMAVGDSFSTMAGSRGRAVLSKRPRKTLEGSAAFFLTSLAAGLFFLPIIPALALALTGSLAELVPALPVLRRWHPGWVNDNLIIPIACSLVLLML